ncbi:MAG: hypothetical protein RJA81_2132 [Planctomycetota bacterium]|jgi:nucleoside-diphosphate-sugar epimerase
MIQKKLAGMIKPLMNWMSQPQDGLVESLEATSGDLVILGAAGKMGPTLAMMARRALSPDRRVIAVSRFSDSAVRTDLETHGIETISCDLLDRLSLKQLPDAPNVIFMAGHKFGTGGQPEKTWVMNAVVPWLVGERYRDSKIVVFSTGCVYPLVSVDSRGSSETDELDPPGEYANSCVARERIFSHFSREYGTPILIFRLNYAIDLRYGVLHDIAQKVLQGQPVDLSMGYVNVIWQGDAVDRALRCLSLTSSPPAILNVTGKERLSVKQLAIEFGERFGRTPVFTGTEGKTAWLSDASKSFSLFGDVSVTLDEMVEATADWLLQGGSSLGKPTHFETRDGKF